MKILCYECGQKYNIDESKISGPSINVKCKKCGSMIKVTKPETVADTSFFEDPSEQDNSGEQDMFTPDEKSDGKPDIPGVSIRTKITVTLVCLVFISLLIVGSIASIQSRSSLSGQVENHLVVTVKQKSKEYGLVFERIQDEAKGVADYASWTYTRKDIANDIDFTMLMPWNGKGYTLDAVSEGIGNEIRFLQRVGSYMKSSVKNNPYLILGYMGTETGLTVFNDEDTVAKIEEIEGYVVYQRPWYLEAKKQKKTIWTKPYVDANTKKLVVTCASPVFDEYNKLVGVIGFDVLLDTLQKDILKISIGYGSHAFLVGKDGSALVKPGMEAKGARWDKAYETTNFLNTPNAEFNTIVSSMVSGQTGLKSYLSEQSEKFIAFAPLKVIGASLAIVASKDMVTKPAKDIQNLIIIITAAVLVISILIGFYLGSTITKPLIRLTTMANLISVGQVELEVIDEDRNDEIGVLTQSINRLVISLKLAMKR